MDFFDNFKKYVVFAILLVAIILFYTRPELDVSSDRFIEVMKSFYYNTFRAERPINSDYAYRSSGVSNTKIYYVHFNDEKNCKEYYRNITVNSKGKPMRSLYRDQRLTRTASEHLSYEDEDIFYIFLYTKNTVMHSQTYATNKSELITIFKVLEEKEKLGFSETIDYYKQYFLNAYTGLFEKNTGVPKAKN